MQTVHPSLTSSDRGRRMMQLLRAKSRLRVQIEAISSFQHLWITPVLTHMLARPNAQLALTAVNCGSVCTVPCLKGMGLFFLSQWEGQQPTQWSLLSCTSTGSATACIPSSCRYAAFRTIHSAQVNDPRHRSTCAGPLPTLPLHVF